MNPLLNRVGRISGRGSMLLIAAMVGAACGTTGPTLRVNTAPTGQSTGGQSGGGFGSQGGGQQKQ